MFSFLSHVTSFSRFSSPDLASVEIAALKEAITHENNDAVREKLQNANLSPEAMQDLLEHAFEKNSSPAVKQTLLQYPNCTPLSALALAVKHDDIFSAKQSLLQGGDPEKITSAFPSSGDMRALLTYVRRKNKLYPPDASSAQDTDLDYALRDAWLSDEAKEMAKSLLDQEIQKRDISDVWQDAVENKRLDLQRAILLLKADTDRCFRVKQKGQVTDKGVAEVMKEIPYFSPKRGLPRNFNCEIKFRDADNELIECRHLVEHRQQVQEQDPQGKFNDDHFASEEAIKSHVSYDTDAKYRYLHNHAMEAHLLYNRDFGKALVKQFIVMAAEGKTSRSKLITLTSTNHAMSVRLRVKEEKGKPCYVAELFDPNHTTSHVRVASSSLHTFETLTLKDFIDTTNYQGYYPETDKLSIMLGRPSLQAEPSMTTLEQDYTKNRKLTSCIEEVNSTALRHMLTYGFAEDIKLLKNKITVDKELLAAKDADGTPGLYMALEAGYADTITAFGELLELLSSESERAELLAAKDVDGTAGFYMALQEGHADAIKSFGELLKLIPPADRATLLAPEDSEGISALASALEDGKLEALKQYIAIVKETAPSLGSQERAGLLKYIRQSHGQKRLGLWSNFSYYSSLKKQDPDFYSQFKEMKMALKS